MPTLKQQPVLPGLEHVVRPRITCSSFKIEWEYDSEVAFNHDDIYGRFTSSIPSADFYVDVYEGILMGDNPDPTETARRRVCELDEGDEDPVTGEILEAVPDEVLANNLSTGYQNHDYQYAVCFQHNPSDKPDTYWAKNPGTTNTTFARLVDAGDFRKHGIHPDLGLHTKGFWIEVFYICEDYERLKSYGESWWHEECTVTVELENEDTGFSMKFDASTWGVESDGVQEYKEEIQDSNIAEVLRLVQEKFPYFTIEMLGEPEVTRV